jgi:hypothetical protein
MLQLMILGYKLTYFVKHETKGKQCNTEYEVINMLVLLIDKTFFIDTHIGTNCAPFLVDISIYSNDAEMINKI